MPPRLPLTPSRVSHGFRACAPRPSSCSSSSSSAYGTGPLFDLLTPALKFRARHASAHALQQKVVEDPEDAYMSLGSGGRVASGDGGNAEAGPSRWTQRAQVCKEGASAEMDLEEERAVTEISGMVSRSGAWSELSVKGKERSWLPTPPEQGVTATPSPSAQIHSTRFHRARRRPLYPSATAPANSIISNSDPQELHSDDRAWPTSPAPSHPCPTTLIDRYRHNPSSRAYGELLARYARRLDNVKAEKDVRDIMGRARIAPASYINGKRRMRPPIIRYEKPPDPEEVLAAEVEDADDLLESQPEVEDADDLLESSSDHALSTMDEEVAGVDATFEAGGEAGEAGAADDAADPDSTEGQEGSHRLRKEHRSKRRRRKEQNMEAAKQEGGLIKEDGSVPNAAFKPDLPPHMINPSPDPPSIDLPADPVPRHPRAPDRRRDPNSLVPNIRATRAWPPRSLPVHPISAQQILQCLHHRLLHPRRYTRRITLSNALDLVRLVPTYRPSSLIDVLHLYLSYAHWPASEELRAEWDAYFRTDMSLFEYEQQDLAGMKGMMNGQTLHLCVLSVIRSRVARDRKSAALRSLLHGAKQAGVSPGTETTRHLVRFCMAIDDKVWCKQLVHHWRDAHAYESNRIASSSINLGAPSTLLPPESKVDRHDASAYNSVPLRISRRGQTLQRWFRTLRRLERKGWVKRASTLDDLEGELLEEQQGQHWRGDYERAEEPIVVDEGEGGRKQ